ncbi:hypothetical protein AaE_010701, partial [Aphanomyces astaci]
MEISQPQSARFLSDNMELLGFGDPCSALIQAVKELFENALDAIQYTEAGMIAVRLKEVEHDANVLEIVCTDTGSGMHANQVAQLCCNVFATTKSSRSISASQCGKFGTVGLGCDAPRYLDINATVFKELVDSSLKVTSTLNSSEFYYAELVIDPEAHDNGYVTALALVRKSKRFHVSEAHKSFSGTEIRLQLPRPHHLVDALRMLMPYFDNLRYCLAASVSVDFSCDIPGFDQYQ